MQGQQELNHQYNEISIFDILQIFWKQKWVILTTVMVCLGISVTYIHFAKPVYQANAYIISPTLGDIAPLNVGRSYEKNALLKPFSTEDIYKVFVDTLLSESIKRDFFNQVYLPSLTDKERSAAPGDILYASFLKKLTIKEDTKFKPSKFSVVADTNNPSKSREWVKKYIDFADKQAVNELVGSIKSQNTALAQQVEQKIEGLREVAKSNRADRLAQLHDALVIAKATGTADYPVNLSKNNLDPTTKMYFRGSKSLESEISVLSERKSDDAYIPNLRALESEYNFYSKMTVPAEAVKPYRLDGVINLPESPIAPKVSLIILLGIVIGLFGGSFLALLIGTRSRKR